MKKKKSCKKKATLSSAILAENGAREGNRYPEGNLNDVFWEPRKLT